jgi:hypothetical protein
MRFIYLEVLDSVEEWPFNVSLFSIHIDMLIIFEKLISINEYNYRFTNISDDIIDVNFIILMESGFQTS